MKTWTFDDTSSIIEVEESLAIEFLKTNRAYKEHISISSSDVWYACTVNDMIVSVIGKKRIGKRIRIKAFYTLKEYRNRGIGTKLLLHCLDSNEYTAFATTDSIGIFTKAGFVTKSVNKNGIAFLEKV